MTKLMGMSPKDYLDVLQNDFDFAGIPALNATNFVYQPDYYELTADGSYFTNLNKAAEIFNKSKQTNLDLQVYLNNLRK